MERMMKQSFKREEFAGGSNENERMKLKLRMIQERIKEL